MQYNRSVSWVKSLFKQTVDGENIVSCGQTAYFSFDMGAEKNKGLAYHRYMFCAENRQILAIVDWPLISVNSFQRRSNDAYKHVTVVRQTLIFLRPHIKRKISGLATRD